METKIATCTFCDGGCAIRAEIGDDLKVSPADPSFPAICSKAALIDEYRHHPKRLLYPLKRKGERGSGEFERVSWDDALDDIAKALSGIIAESGPESVAFVEMPLNHGFGGITRRLMNGIGSPNYLTALALCMGNTAQVHRLVYGWLASPDWDNADCIVYFGQDRGPERWPAEYLRLNAALDRGAKLICVDPRLTDTAKRADHHLPIRYGTDAALMLGWLNVIIDEGLYDKDFVAASCTGFDALKDRVADYTPEKVARICEVDANLIRETARVYAKSEAAIIPWGVVGDMQVNSTSMLQCQCILRAICGFLGKSERVFGPRKGVVGNSELAAFELLGQEQREKQLGRDAHPLMTTRTSELYRSRETEIGLDYPEDIMAESHGCDASSLFAAMRGEDPYPIRAIISAANNTVMSFAGQPGITEAFMNQDLVVVFENWMTPTAQLADYVLPGDMWAERDTLGKAFDVAPFVEANQAFRDPVGECRSWYDVVKGLADRLGLKDLFPWEDSHEMFDWRLADSGIDFDDLCDVRALMLEGAGDGSFMTPSGKVELFSSVLQALGLDPLPSYFEPEDPGAEDGDYRYLAFAGVRENANYNTALRQMPSLREREPEPRFFINPRDAEEEGVREGEWHTVKSAYGAAKMMAHIDDAQPEKTIRVPHGWWKPEVAPGMETGLSGAMEYNDGMLFPDAQWNLDGPQGVPGFRGSIHVRID